MKCAWPFDDCEKPIRCKNRCKKHYTRYRQYDGRDVPLQKPATLNGEWGSWYIDKSSGYVRRGRRVNGKNQRQAQHRHIMEQHLGRALLAEENIHHINGDRTDNRLENLEIWNTSQPSGQRAEDKLKWARKIIELYG